MGPIVNTAIGKKFISYAVYANSGNGWRSEEGGESVPGTIEMRANVPR
jgi:hypothetical protein